MEKTTTIIITAFLFMFSTFYMFDLDKKVESKKILDADHKLEIPKNIETILDKSCIGCHKTESKNNKGKAKLDFDKMKNGDYSSGKTMSKLRGIIKSINEKKMPPKKFLKKYPERSVSEKDEKLIVDWAKTQGKALKK